MKKIHLVIICCLSASTIFSQFDIGQKILGGNIGFSNTKIQNPINNSYTSNNSYFNFSPSIGWYKKANKVSGVAFSYGYNRNKNVSEINNSTQLTRSNSTGVEYFSQRFFPLSQKLFFTVNASAGLNYSFGENKSSTNNTENKLKTRGYGIAAAVAPGLSYRLTQRFLFDVYLSNLLNIIYYNQFTKDPLTDKKQDIQKSFAVSTSLSSNNLGNVGLGFRWLLKK